MEIKTKFSIGDECYYIYRENNEIIINEVVILEIYLDKSGYKYSYDCVNPINEECLILKTDKEGLIKKIDGILRDIKLSNLY